MHGILRVRFPALHDDYEHYKDRIMETITENLSVDTRVANELIIRSAENQWPVHIQLGIPFKTENGNRMSEMTVEYIDDFPFGQKLDEVINDVFELKEEE